ncbi:MAG TPA: thioredoxin domain-containing protein [Anaerolineales bacterium]|nr:thioredoxin domain-containing protein [Anaerolineales bacterium]
MNDPASTPDSPVETLPDAGYIHIRRSHLYAFLIPLAFAAGLASGYLAWGRRVPTAAPPAANAPQRFDVSVDDDPSLGPDDAPVTIIEFSDFNCPYCRRFHVETFPGLMEAYEGKIRFVYRDFPITSAESSVAAQAANCAGRQGKYWEFHDALFSGSLGLSRDAYQGYAGQLGMDVTALNACLDSGDELAEVQSDARAASQLGVTGTPTFFVNGLPLVGAQPMEQFSLLIEGELAP